MFSAETGHGIIR